MKGLNILDVIITLTKEIKKTTTTDDDTSFYTSYNGYKFGNLK